MSVTELEARLLVAQRQPREEYIEEVIGVLSSRLQGSAHRRCNAVITGRLKELSVDTRKDGE